MRACLRALRIGPTLGLALITLIPLITLACGGAEFVTAGSDDAGLGGDSSVVDATVTTDGNVTNDGAVVETGSGDASGGDSGGVSGGDSGDAGATGDGGDGGFACPSPDLTVVFCSDFDHATTPPWEWSSDPITSEGNETVDTTHHLTAPNGFAASNSALVASSGYTIASLGYQFTSIAGRIDYVFNMYVETYDTIDNPPIGVAQLIVGETTPSSEFSLQLVLKGGQLELSQIFTGTDGGQQTPSTTVGAVATGTWVQVELLLDRRTANWTATIYLDGVSKLDIQTAITPSNENLEVDLGILGVLPITTANSITFDNVTVRAY
ncbi:MAG: hypothetical protein ACLQVI_20155 [Polyangiaceae bacterium]